ncbi:MAG: DUF3137 domain-containing protein [Oscillospiraceae bacterium]|nr:DUF3137 domain-containing protein [Oscillospiraceae bacterium]
MPRNERTREERFDKFLHGLDNNYVDSHPTGKPLPALSDAELEKLINELTPKIKKNAVVAKVCAIIATIFYILARFETFGPGLLIGSIGLIVLAVFTGEKVARYKKRLKCVVSNNIVRGVLNDKFELDIYAPGSHIRQSIIEFTDLFPKWNRISGSDLVEGTYKGVKFSFSDLLLRHETGSGKNRKVVTRFKGQWLIIELSKEIPRGVQLRARIGEVGVGRKIKSDIETENIEFNQKFQIKTRDPHTAFYVLTPHFMEYILNAKRRAGAQVFMSFDRNQIHIALHNGRDLFEPSNKKLFAVSNIATLRMQMQWDVNYITNIIDEFLLNENLFGTTALPNELPSAEGNNQTGGEI